jgi:inositol oxygenase
MSELRVYEEGTPQQQLYKEMHKNQTYSYIINKLEQYSQLNNTKMKMTKALSLMNNFIDPSDPDLDEENIIHAYQTAERIRKKYPENKQYQLIGLIHDLGKVLFTFGEPNWAVVGDTFVLGCELPDCIVYYDTLKDNPDFNDPKYNTELGVYKKGCGLDNLKISFGHDEYLYQVLKQNKNHLISDKYMNIIRYHSFYPWHTGGAYEIFMNDKDKGTLKDILDFNQFDLYSKEDKEFELTNDIKEYYDDLLNEYFPSDLQW